MANQGLMAKRRMRFRVNTFAFIAIFFPVEFAAFNTSENLLYLLAAFVFGFPVLALAVSKISFRGIEMRREAPTAVHRGEAFSVTAHVKNQKRVLPGVSLRIAFSGEASEAYLPVLPAKTSATLGLSRVMMRRGVHTLPGIEIASSFPMGFVERSAVIEDALAVIVYPRVHRIDRDALEQLDDSGNRPRPTMARGDEFYALREYVPGDDIRLICWRVSARLGELIVRDLEPGSARSVAILMDTRGRLDTQEADEAFELAADLVASLAVAFLDRQYSVALVTPQGAVPLGQGEGQIVRVLDLLARVAPVGYETLGDDWFRSSGDLGGATKLCVATDRAQWGGSGLGGSLRVLNPEEVLHAS